MIPLPNEEVTPPVTNMYFEEDMDCQKNSGAKVAYLIYGPPACLKIFRF